MFPPEFLNTIKDGSLPPHSLKLKNGSPIILLRNINPKEGLCNGTRLICRNFRPHVRGRNNDWYLCGDACLYSTHYPISIQSGSSFHDETKAVSNTTCLHNDHQQVPRSNNAPSRCVLADTLLYAWAIVCGPISGDDEG